MKKLLSGVLTVSLVASTVGIIPAPMVSKAEIIADSPESVTDSSKYETNDIIITYKKEANATEKKTMSICGLKDSESADAEVSKLTDNSVVLKLDSEEELETAIESLSEDSRVDYIQPNYIYHLCDTDLNAVYSTVSQNTDFGKQWALYNDGTTNYTEELSISSFWNLPTKVSVQATSRIDIGLPEAWSICASPKRKVVVAIVDTGVMYDHDDLAEHMWVNTSEIAGDDIDNDNNGYVDDIYGWNFYDSSVYQTSTPSRPGRGRSSTPTPSPTPFVGNNTYYNKNSNIEDSHGTHVAGTIAASNNDTGIVGIASNADVKIMSVKALGGEEGYGTTESVVKGIQYAEENGADICNLSLGGEDDDTMLRTVMENSSMLFTIAAGNGDEYTGQAVNIDSSPIYPASYNFDNIIVVANLQCNGELHWTSNYGSSSVDIAAPGSYIYSTSTFNGIYSSTTSIPASSSYEYMTGTSMAAPMAAGVAAMLYSCYDDLTLQDVKKIMMDSASPLDNLTGKCVSQGYLNAYAAVQLARYNSVTQTTEPKLPVSAQPTPSATPTASPSPTATAKLTVSPSPTASPTTSPQTTATINPTASPSPTASGTPTISPQPTAAPQPTTYANSPSSTPTKTAAPMITAAPDSTIKPTATTAIYFTDTPATIAPTTEANIVSSTPYMTDMPVPTQTLIDIETPSVTSTPVPDITDTPVYDALTVKKVSVSGGSTRYIGTSYTIKPTVSGGNGNYQYRYLVSKGSTKYINKDYSGSSSIKWKPTVAGDYQIKVTVQDSNGYSDYYSLQVHITNVKIKSLKTNKTLKKGATVKFTAKANGGVGTLTYKFTIKRTKGTYSRTRSSKKNVFSWKIPAKGTYKLTLQITDSKKNTVKKTYTLKVKK